MDRPPPEPPASLQVVVMGVSGCGKTTLSRALGQALGLDVVDGDDLHLPQSVAKMRAGQPLQDEAAGCVVACSALKRAYRDRIRAACPQVVFLFLDGAREPLLQRMQQRQGHYMPVALLDSQLATLERPGPDEPDVVHLQVEDTPEDQVASALRGLARHRAA